MRRPQFLLVVTALAFTVGSALAVAQSTEPPVALKDAASSAEGPRHEADRDVPIAAREGEDEGEGGGEIAGAAAERLAALAYPRGYLTTRASLRAEAATEAAPETLQPSDFAPGVNATAIRAQAGNAWTAVGPAGQIKPPTSPWASPPIVAGRTTAIVVDPNCGSVGKGCRVWIGAAGGGVWRTPDATLATPTWTYVSASIPSNAIGALALDPNDTTGNTIYAGTGEPNGSSDSEAGVGVYKSVDGGDSWSLITATRAFAIDRGVGDIAIKPGNPNTIIIGTQVARHGSGSVSGGSFTPPNAPAVGAYLSTDGGTTFTKSLAPVTPTGDPANRTDTFAGGVTSIVFDPVDPTVIYATVTGSGLWRYQSGSWAKVLAPGEPSDTYGRLSVSAIAAGSATHLYVLDGSIPRIMRSLDGRAATPAWTSLTPATEDLTSNLYGSYALCGTQCWYDQFIAGYRAGGSDVVWAGGSMAYDEVPGAGGTLDGVSNGRAVIRSANADADPAAVLWNDVTSGADSSKLGNHPDLHAIAFNPTDPLQAFIGSDGGVVRTDGGFVSDSAECATRSTISGNATRLARCQQLLAAVPAHVTGISEGLNTLQLQGVDATEVAPTTLIAGYQDNGTATNAGAATWTGVIGGDGGPPAYDVTGPTLAYHQYYNGWIDVSHDSGAAGSWYTIVQPMYASGEERLFYAPLLADPVVSGTVFVGWQSVWRSPDSGGTLAALQAADCGETGNGWVGCGDFQRLGSDLTAVGLGTRSGGNVSVIARAASDRTTLWTATSRGRVFISTNATAPAAAVAFTRLDDDSALDPTRFPSAIAVDPNDANHAWVAYAGYNAYTPTTPGHLFEVRYNAATGTSTWTDRSYDLGDVPLRTMAYDPLLGDIYAAGDWGVLRLPGGASAWMDAGTELPPVATYGLDILPTSRLLYAATHGRGVYQLTLGSPEPGPAPQPDQPVTAPAAQPTSATTSELDVRIAVLPRGLRVGRDGRVLIRLTASSAPGGGTVTLQRPKGGKLVSSRFRYTTKSVPVRIRLTQAVRTELKQKGKLRIVIVARLTDAAGTTSTVRQATTLLAPLGSR